MESEPPRERARFVAHLAPARAGPHCGAGFQVNAGRHYGLLAGGER